MIVNVAYESDIEPFFFFELCKSLKSSDRDGRTDADSRWGRRYNYGWRLGSGLSFASLDG